MKYNLRLKIKKRTQTGWLMWFLIVFPFTFGTLIDILHMPNAIKYLLDLAWLALLVYIVRFSGMLNFRKTRHFLIWVFLFLSFTVLVYIFRYQSLLYYLWGLRNNFRYYVTFIALTVFMSREDGDSYLCLFDKLFWVEFGLCLIQYLLGYKGDFLGGLFGIETGSNGYLNMFYIIMTARTVLLCLNKRETLHMCIAKCAAILLVAALAELKFFFIEFAVIVVLAVLITDFSWRKVWIILASALGIVAGIAMLCTIYPFFRDVYSIEGLLEIATSEQGYTYRGDLNRLTVISEVNRRFFSSWIDQMFGFGLGNCDGSTFTFLCSPFSVQYSWTHYNLFSSSFVYLEMGWIGLGFFFGFFLLYYFVTKKLEKTGQADIHHCQLARIVSLCCCLVCIYNSSLRTEVGYMAYFVLALPYMKPTKSDRIQRKDYESITTSGV